MHTSFGYSSALMSARKLSKSSLTELSFAFFTTGTPPGAVGAGRCDVSGCEQAERPTFAPELVSGRFTCNDVGTSEAAADGTDT